MKLYGIKLIIFSISNIALAQILNPSGESDGLNIKLINDTIYEALAKTEFFDNVVRIASWNLHDDPTRSNWDANREEVCEFLKRITPMVFGLQEVRKDQIEYLKQCLPFYKVIATPKGLLPESLYTPIFYRTDLRQFRYVRSGTFWLSKRLLAKLSGSKLPSAEKPRICTWTHMRFATRLTQYPLSRGSHVYRNFMWLRQVIGLPRKRRRRRRTKWKWKDVIIANTDLDSNDPDVAKKQLEFLFDYLYSVEMGPRKYPVILLGDLKWEGNPDLYQTIKEKGGMSNAMESSRVTYPAVFDKNMIDTNIVDYIYQKRLKGVVSASINDKLQTSVSFSPVFSAFIF